MDNETDAIIQGVLRERFREQTVLTIAHRLNTIKDSDQIVVMNDGSGVAEGSPRDFPLFSSPLTINDE